MFNKHTWEEVSELTSIRNYPKLPCPYCSSYNLVLDESSIVYRELSSTAVKAYTDKFKLKDINDVSLSDHTLIRMVFMMAEYADSSAYAPSQFVAFFTCSMCMENVSAIGISKVPKNNSSAITQIKVESFSPPIPMFSLDSTTPNSINEELLSSFNHFHSDLSSAGNRLRRAMEKLCKELDCYETNLHRSIQALSKKFPQEAKWLEPLKLVGNEATHSDGVSESDLLDSYQVFEVVLNIFQRKKIEQITDNTAAKLDLKFTKKAK